jgi:hypothetical protein
MSFADVEMNGCKETSTRDVGAKDLRGGERKLNTPVPPIPHSVQDRELTIVKGLARQRGPPHLLVGRVTLGQGNLPEADSWNAASRSTLE